MISALSGLLRHVSDDRVHLAVGPMLCELLVPAADVPQLQENIGSELTFHTLFYIEGDASGGNLSPRLIGFQRKEDKRFFEKFIDVKGIGPKKALRALVRPTGEIARAIESKDTRYLSGLPQIGKRTAELIVAELAGKVEAFATFGGGTTTAAKATPSRRNDAEEDAIAALMGLGERRADAEALLGRVRQSHPDMNETSALLREMLRLRSAR